MANKQDFIEAYLQAYHLMHRYQMIWYGKNFSGMDPQQGQGRILSALRQTHCDTQKALGQALDLRPQSLGELLQKLEKHGYIRRYRSPTDKRALIVELTEKGESFHMQQPDYDEIFADLNRAERETLRKAFDKISKRLQEQIKRENEYVYYY